MIQITPKVKYGFLSSCDKIFPPMVIAEITNVCNLECIHCPHKLISKEKEYKPKHMDLRLYQRIIEEVSNYKNVIFRLLCDGEPLCHPNFVDMVKLAKEKKIAPVNVITNGVLLNKELSASILEAGIDAVEISLDALTKTTYKKIRKGSNHELVYSNVHNFIEMRSKMKARTKILVSIIDQPEVESELSSFINYWSPRVDRVITRTYTSINGLVDISKMKIDCSGERWPCPQLWRRFFINVDGFAEFCVEDWYDETIIGDVNKNSIQEIWQSPQYEGIRELHLYNKFSEVPYCNRCKDWKAREWNYDYFYALKQVLNTGGA